MLSLITLGRDRVSQNDALDDSVGLRMAGSRFSTTANSRSHDERTGKVRVNDSYPWMGLYPPGTSWKKRVSFRRGLCLWSHASTLY